MTERQRAVTDRELQVDAPEFLWDEGGLSDIHLLVLSPILRTLHDHAARRVIDIGCGNGAFSAALAAHGFDVTGLDSSASGIKIATEAYPELAFKKHDINEPLPRELHSQFDAVVSVEVIEHLFRPRELLKRASEALHPSGMVALTTPYHGYLKNLAIALLGGFDHHVHPLRDYGHIKFFSRKTIRNLIEETGFAVDQITSVGRIRPFAKSMVAIAHRIEA